MHLFVFKTNVYLLLLHNANKVLILNILQLLFKKIHNK
jgi:hypothetical protein